MTSRRPSPPGSSVQTVAMVVTALAAVAAVLTQWKEHPQLALGLVAVAALAGAPNLYAQLAARLMPHLERRTRDRKAMAHRSELSQYLKRFQRFVEAGDGGNLRRIVVDLCDNNADSVSRFCPPDYLWEMVPLLLERYHNDPPKNATEFLYAIRQLSLYVASYNREYVREPLRRLARAQIMADLTLQRKQDFERRIEDFRERWVRFLDDFQQLLERVDEPIAGGLLRPYFERPQKL